MQVRPHLCFQLITPSVHWQQKMIGGTEEAASLKWKFSPDSCLSYLQLRAHKYQPASELALLTASGGSPTLLVEDQEQEESESGLPYAYLHSFQELEVNIGTSVLSVH